MTDRAWSPLNSKLPLQRTATSPGGEKFDCSILLDYIRRSIPIDGKIWPSTYLPNPYMD